MDERKDAESAGAKPAAKGDLPHVESPSISPANPDFVAEAPSAAMNAPADETEDTETKTPLFAGLAQHRRAALFAASIAGAIAFGALVGAFASGGLSPQLPRKDAVGMEERKAMEKSIAHLTKEISSLKASIEATTKSASTQVPKVSARIEQAPETTGSISGQREVQQVAAPAKATVLQDWSIRFQRDGFVYVEWRGELYQVMPGIPLPGVGRVETIKRQDGRLVVVTSKGLIVAQRDRDFFTR